MNQFMGTLIIVFSGILAFAQIQEENIGIKPDCSETPVSIDDLLAIEKKKDIRSALDFFKALPPQSLQSFTLVKRTQSLQHHGVSSRFPRVLRGTADGKIIMSFVCNPASHDYNKIEILHYVDPPVAEWRTLSLDFSEKSEKIGSLALEDVATQFKSRVVHNQRTCTKCHGIGGTGSTDIRPLFSDYPKWTGFYGSDDDVLHVGSREYREYLDFLEHSRDNECFQSLPWPESDKPAYALYPYHEGYNLDEVDPNQVTLQQETEVIKINDYHMRPNLKLTDSLSHLMAQRLAWKFLKSDEYQKAAPLFLMEAVSCKNVDYARYIKREYPELFLFENVEGFTYMDPLTSQSRARFLFSLGKEIGLLNADWQMHFNEDSRRYYNTGAAGDDRRDISITQMAQGVLLRELAKSFPKLEAYFKLSRGVSKFFSPQDFQCIDDIAGSIRLDSLEDRAKLCESLENIYLSETSFEAAPQSAPINLAMPIDFIPSLELGNRIKNEIPNRYFSLESLSRGEEVMQSSCTFCHGFVGGLSPHYQFLTSINEFKSKLQNDASFLWQTLSYIDSGRMPKGSVLNEDEKQSVKAYILELSRD